MKSLVALKDLWWDFSEIRLDEPVFVTERLFLQQLTSSEGSPIYLSLNALSGAVDIMKQEEGRLLKEIIHNGTLPKESGSDSLVRSLKQNGYLFASREQEQVFYRQIVDYWTDKRLAESDLLVFFSIDTLCSMGCAYCFQRQAQRGEIELERAVMTPETLDHAFAALDDIREQTGRPVKWAVLFGGEPLQERFTGTISKTIELAQQRGYEVVSFSNLAMIGDKLFDALCHHRLDISWIETTIDGPLTAHNELRGLTHAYELTTLNIERLLDAGIPITVRTNIGPRNIDFLPELAMEFEARGWYDTSTFKHIVALQTDRHLDNGSIFREDKGFSRYLALRDRYPSMKHLQDYNIVYVLYHLAVALQMRNIIPGVDYRTDLRPVVIHCPTGAGSELVFTGQPVVEGEKGYSIYCCAECGSNIEPGKPFRIGSYYPELTFFEAEAAAWGNPDYLFAERSIRNVEGCYECRAALFCGSACSLESINAHGTAMIPHCKDANEIIESFLAAENDRLYRIGSQILADGV